MNPAHHPDQGQPTRPRSLRELRRVAGLNQIEVVEQVKQAMPDVRFSQPALSRAEKGHGRLDPQIVRLLCAIYPATPAEQDTLIQQAENAATGYVDSRVVLQSGNTINLQQRFARLERDAIEIRAFNPVMVLGVLQTPAYAATVFGTSEEDPLVTGRMSRQRQLITNQRRRWTLILTEGALRWQARSATIMAEQIEHLIELSTLAHVHLGLIDWRTPAEVFPHTAFHLYDDTAAAVATRDGTAIITDRTRLTDYVSLFDNLTDLASFGDTTRDALRHIAHDYRSLPKDE